LPAPTWGSWVDRTRPAAATARRSGSAPPQTVSLMRASPAPEHCTARLRSRLRTVTLSRLWWPARQARTCGCRVGQSAGGRALLRNDMHRAGFGRTIASWISVVVRMPCPGPPVPPDRLAGCAPKLPRQSGIRRRRIRSPDRQPRVVRSSPDAAPGAARQAPWRHFR
jgi:hypothetical protein